MGFFSKLWKTVKKVIAPVAKIASFIPGPWQPFAIAATSIMGAIGSYKSGERAIDLASAQRQLGERAIGANPWYAGGGAAGAGEALTSVISGDFESDPGYQLAQKAAAATSSTQPGGYSAMAAANAAMQWQNQRIQALSQPAGAGFNPVGGYQVAGNLQQSAARLESQGLASEQYGLNQAAGAVLPWLQGWMKNRGLGNPDWEAEMPPPSPTFGSTNPDWTPEVPA